MAGSITISINPKGVVEKKTTQDVILESFSPDQLTDVQREIAHINLAINNIDVFKQRRLDALNARLTELNTVISLLK